MANETTKPAPRLTWDQLAEYISKLSPEQRQTDVTLFDPHITEFFQLSTFIGNWADFPDSEYVEEADGVLDDNHPFLAI